MLDLSPAIHCDKYLNIMPATPLLIGLEFSSPPAPALTDREFLLRLQLTERWDFDLQSAFLYLKSKESAIVVTDRNQHITWVSRGFSRMTGYQPWEACGRRPGFLQGPATSPEMRQKIRQNLSEAQPFTGTIVNYRKSGEPYLCAIHLFPLFTPERELVHFIALEKEKPMA